MNMKKQLAGKKLKKVASQPEEKVIPSSLSSARLGVQSAPQRIKTPSVLPFPLMALLKAMVPMPGDHNLIILVDHATFGMPVENIYVSKEDVF